jgi:hypothetical protein
VPASPSPDAAAPGDGSADVGVDASPAADAGDAAADGPPASSADPVCASADSNGFFSSCAACPDRNCNTISAQGRTRYACGCGGGCPCGLRCGSYQIAPNVRISNVCVR